MLTNPGGPGGSGLILSILGAFVPKNAGSAFDWIGFDPRGVGASTPSLHCQSNYFKGDRPPYRPTTSAILYQWLNRSQRYASECAALPHSELFNHVRTVDSVNDMESMRKALGQSKINYYGFSYGTYLGEVYATLHPDRVRRFVFDGVIDPQRVFYKSNLDQDRAFNTTFTIYFRWLAKYASVYHVGNTTDEVRQRYLQAIKDLDKQAAGGVLGGDELTDVFTSAGYYVFGWEDIAQAWSAYVNHRDATGLINLYQGANPTTPGGDNGFAMYLGTQCTDAQWPTNILKVLDDNQRYDAHYPYLTWSNGWFNGPCNYWHFKAGTPVTVDGSHVHGHILMINETFDAATPFSGALVARSLFPTASMIEGYHGSTHAGSLSGVGCTDNTIAKYLTTGQVPTRQPGTTSDKLCPPVPQPDPTASAARRSSSVMGAAWARVQAALMSANR